MSFDKLFNINIIHKDGTVIDHGEIYYIGYEMKINFKEA